MTRFKQMVKPFQQKPPLLLPKLNQFPLNSNFSTTQTLLAKKLGVMTRFKQMVKDYWYIIIPVEAVTSVLWYGSIYIALRSGVDIGDLLTTLGIPEDKLPSSGGGAGYHAITFFCYKIISPLRHTLSIGITGAIVTGLNKTRPGYLRTSSSIAHDAREAGADMMEKYDDKLAEGKEMYREKVAEGKEIYEDKMSEGKEKIEEWKLKAEEKKVTVEKRFTRTKCLREKRKLRNGNLKQ